MSGWRWQLWKTRIRVVCRERHHVDISEKGISTKDESSSATHNRHKLGRLCGDMDQLQKHIDSIVSSKNVNPREVCNLDCHTSCVLYKMAQVQLSPHKGSQNSKTCFDEYQIEHFLAWITRISNLMVKLRRSGRHQLYRPKGQTRGSFGWLNMMTWSNGSGTSSNLAYELNIPTHMPLIKQQKGILVISPVFPAWKFS